MVRILVRLGLTPLAHSPKLVDHLLEALLVGHTNSVAESGGMRQRHSPAARARPC